MACCLTMLYISVFWLTLFGHAFSFSGGFYTSDSNLEQSILLKPLGKKHLSALEMEILELLGLHKRPKPRYHEIHSSAPQYLIDLYSEIKESESDDGKKPKQTKKKHSKQQQTLAYESDFIVSFVNKINQEYPHIRHEKDKRFWFDTTKVPADEEMVAAEFRIFRNSTKRGMSKKSKYIVSLYAVTDIDVPNTNTLQLVEEIVVLKETGWLTFNVSGVVMNWIAFPQKNLGLYLKIRHFDSPSHTVDPHELGIVCSTGPEKYQPFMVAFFKTSNRLRVRRSARKRQQESYYDHDTYNPYGYIKEKYTSKRRNCQRSTLYVSFKDLGWEDWIIAPDGYGSFFCEGECSFPLNAHMNATNHAIVQTLVHLMDPSVVPKPQCSPTQLSAITVLYFDNDANVILKKYRNMVVKSCGCH